MRNRVFILTVAALAILAACGDPSPIEQLAAEPPAPTGKVARLRVAAAEPDLTCDGNTHLVRIWLDDLPRVAVERPDIPSSAPATAGVSAFQFKLTFDPAIVRVREDGDVRLGPDLNSLIAGPGAPAHFAAARPFVDNYAGYAFMGGLNLGLASDVRVAVPGQKATPLPPPLGLDPLVAGRGALLFEVSIEAIGAGPVELTLADAQLLAGVKHEYTPIDVIPATVTVTGDCKAVPSATPRVMPTGTPVIPTPPPGPAAYTVVVAEAAHVSRPDCPGDWLAARSTSVSVCFPGGWSAAQRPAAASYGAAFTLTNKNLAVFVGIEWVAKTPLSAHAVDTLAELCVALGDGYGIPFTPAAIRLGSVSADACLGTGDTGEGGADPIYAFATVPGGYIQIYVTQRDPATTTAILEILSSLEVR